MQTIKINTLKLLSKEPIHKIKTTSFGLYIKLDQAAFWCRIPEKITIDKGFIEGIAYYVGDGRTKTNRGLSIVDMEDSIIRFFIRWLIKYLKVNRKNIKILQRPACKELKIHRTALKKIFDLILPIVKEISLQNKEFASAYLRGIMAAEGSPKYNKKSRSRNIHLKMADKDEIKYIRSLLKRINVKSSFLYSRSDNEWLVTISGVYELNKLKEIGIFKLHKKRHKKFNNFMSTYKRKQVKKGDVNRFFIKRFLEFEKTEEEASAPKFANYLERHRTRAINVLRKLQKEGLVEGKRIKKTGRPYVFKVTKKGRKLINNLSERF
jgi:DNA-binding MarR family transcriptional regulator